ncbi:MAG: GNAT family N-acetyltransferase [Clostridiales bacterium]|nr:GNAT family N-acetyltransferase [Clostridiales bacterium]
MYRVVHPNTPVDGTPAENAYLVLDEVGNTAGQGRVIYQYLPHMDPDCPINLYFDMKCDLAGRYVLLGALLARARQLRDVNPQVHARVYTMVHPEDTDSQAFYTSSGMTLEQRESLVSLQIPAAESRLPMGCQVFAVPMNTPEEKLSFLNRLNNNDIRHIDFVLLQQFMRTSHFQLLGLTRENTVVSELMMVGNGSSAELMAVYTYPTYRKQGLAKALLHRSMVILQSEGVSHFTARVMTRSKPQMGLVNAFGAQEEEVISLFPELML